MTMKSATRMNNENNSLRNHVILIIKGALVAQIELKNIQLWLKPVRRVSSRIGIPSFWSGRICFNSSIAIGFCAMLLYFFWGAKWWQKPSLITDAGGGPSVPRTFQCWFWFGRTGPPRTYRLVRSGDWIYRTCETKLLINLSAKVLTQADSPIEALAKPALPNEALGKRQVW